MSGLTKFLTTVSILLIILMVTFAFALRSDGGQDLVRERLSEWIGMDVQIGKCRIGWPYVVVVEDVVFPPGDLKPTTAGFAVEEMRIGLARGARLSVRAIGGRLQLVQQPDRKWHPEPFSQLGALPFGTLVDVVALSKGIGKRVNLRLEDCTLVWLNETGAEGAMARNVGFERSPVRLPGRKMMYYRLSAFQVLGVGGQEVNDIEREWLSSDKMPYIEIFSRQQTMPAGAAAFWNVRPATETETAPAQSTEGAE